jgi:hypothetical protein
MKRIARTTLGISIGLSLGWSLAGLLPGAGTNPSWADDQTAPASQPAAGENQTRTDTAPASQPDLSARATTQHTAQTQPASIQPFTKPKPQHAAEPPDVTTENNLENLAEDGLDEESDLPVGIHDHNVEPSPAAEPPAPHDPSHLEIQTETHHDAHGDLAAERDSHASHDTHASHDPNPADHLVPQPQDITWYRPVIWAVAGLFIAAVLIGIPALIMKSPEPQDLPPTDDHDSTHADPPAHHH